LQLPRHLSTFEGINLRTIGVISKLISSVVAAIFFVGFGVLLMHHIGAIEAQMVSSTQATLDIQARNLEALAQTQIDTLRDEINQLAGSTKLIDAVAPTETKEAVTEPPALPKDRSTGAVATPMVTPREASVEDKLNVWKKSLNDQQITLVADLQGRVLSSDFANITKGSVLSDNDAMSALFTSALAGQTLLTFQSKPEGKVALLAGVPILKNGTIVGVLVTEKPFRLWPGSGIRSALAVKNQIITGELPFDIGTLSQLEGKTFLGKAIHLGAPKVLGIRLPKITAQFFTSHEAGVWARTFRIVGVDGSAGYVAFDNSSNLRRLHNLRGTVVFGLAALWLLHFISTIVIGLRQVSAKSTTPTKTTATTTTRESVPGTSSPKLASEFLEPPPPPPLPRFQEPSIPALEKPFGSVSPITTTPKPDFGTLELDTKVHPLPQLGDLLDFVEPPPLPMELPQATAAPKTPDYFHQVFDEFVAARQSCGEMGTLSYDKFKTRLEQSRNDVIAKHHCNDVRFQVYVKDGKAALKATPVTL
jgi:hypothetical protein